MATDLNLHRRSTGASPDTPEGRARDREVRNRERTWIICFCLDRSFSAQMGKPHSIKEDYIIRNATEWCKGPLAVPADMGLAAYVVSPRSWLCERGGRLLGGVLLGAAAAAV